MKISVTFLSAALLGGCASFGCNSTPEARAGAYCQMEAQTGSIQTHFTVPALEAPAKGTHIFDGVRWTCLGEAIAKPGSRIPVIFKPKVGHLPNAHGFANTYTTQIDVRTGLSGFEMQRAIAWEQRRFSGCFPETGNLLDIKLR